MNQILPCDWLPERARWSYLARSGLPAVSRKKNFPVSLHKLAKKELGQYPAILTKQAWSITHIYCSLVWANIFKANTHKLQLVQNFVARIIPKT